MRPAGIPKTSGILPRRIFVFLWVFHKLVITPLQVLERVSPGWIILLRLRLAKQLHRRTRFVRFAKQFPARTLGGVTLFVEDDLRDAFFVGVAVVVDCLFTFSQ